MQSDVARFTKGEGRRNLGYMKSKRREDNGLIGKSKGSKHLLRD
jgi:hypothetical protein